MAVFSGGGTGGHLYPALALAAALTERRPDVRPFFVGARRGLEARIFPERELDHLLLPIEGIRRDSMFANIRVMALLVAAVRQVAETFQRLRPSLVVVTGGYAGGPAGFAAVITRTCLVLQEQNSLPGLTTRVLSLFAREVHVAFPEAVSALPRRTRRKVRVSGNPVRAPVRYDRLRAAKTFGLDADGITVLVVGGSQGSSALNAVILEALQGVAAGRLERPSGVQLLWATGPAHIGKTEASLEELRGPDWVHAVGYIHEMPVALSVAELAVSRAGAMTTSEFLAWGLPAVLVPLPSAAEDHQTRNARALGDAGAALHLPQEALSGETLWAAITSLIRDSKARAEMSEAAKGCGRPHAASEIATSLDRFLPESEGGSMASQSVRSDR